MREPALQWWRGITSKKILCFVVALVFWTIALVLFLPKWADLSRANISKTRINSSALIPLSLLAKWADLSRANISKIQINSSALIPSPLSLLAKWADLSRANISKTRINSSVLIPLTKDGKFCRLLPAYCDQGRHIKRWLSKRPKFLPLPLRPMRPMQFAHSSNQTFPVSIVVDSSALRFRKRLHPLFRVPARREI